MVVRVGNGRHGMYYQFLKLPIGDSRIVHRQNSVQSRIEMSKRLLEVKLAR